MLTKYYFSFFTFLFVKPVRILLLSSMFCLSIIRFYYYNIIYYDYIFNSDSAFRLTFALEIQRVSNLFSPDWYFVNHDYHFFNLHLIVLFLSLFHRLSYLDFVISQWIGYLILIVGITYFVTFLGGNISQVISSIFFISFGLSSEFDEWIHGGQAYLISLLFFLFCLPHLYLYLEKQRIIFLVLPSIFLIIQFISNPIRAILYNTLPVYFLIIYHHFTVSRKSLPTVFIFLYLPFIFITGLIVHFIISCNVNDVSGVANLNFISYDMLVTKIYFLLFGLFKTFFSYSLTFNYSTEHVEHTAILFTIILSGLIASVLRLGLRNLSRQTPERTYSISISISSTILVVVALSITTTLLDTSTFQAASSSTRYFVPMITIIILCILSTPLTLLTVIFRLLLLSSVFINNTPLFSFSPEQYYNWDHNVYSPSANVNRRMTRALIDRHITRCYATYWNASVITVKTNHNIVVRPIHFVSGIPLPMRFASSEAWFTEERDQPSGSCLIITADEMVLLDYTALLSYDLSPTLYAHDELIIMTFTNTFAERLPGWDMYFRDLKEVVASPTMPHKIGQFTTTVAGNPAICSHSNDLGFLAHGPYWPIRAGLYKAVFKFDELEAASRSGYVDVATGTGKRVLATAPIVNSQSEMSLQFQVLHADTIELRVYVDGATPLCYLGGTIASASN